MCEHQNSQPPTATMGRKPHFLLLSYPAHSNVNPAFQFAKRLISHGALVTLTTSLSARPRIPTEASLLDGLNLAFFSDGFDDGLKHTAGKGLFVSEFERRGSEALTEHISAKEKEGERFTCLICTSLIPWGVEVARAFHLPSVLLWIQPATVFDVYYYYFNGYGDEIRKLENDNDLSSWIKLPGLPSLSIRDFPSFLNPNKDDSAVSSDRRAKFQKLWDMYREETEPVILVNSFDGLESDALNSINGFKLLAIGPLIPSALQLDGGDPPETSTESETFRNSKSYTEWLNSKPVSSVVYVSFGSISVLSKQQVEELGRGLLKCGRPFLWVIRETKSNGDDEKENQSIISCRKELEKQGIIVPWCSQMEVLSHSSVGCFVSHCGWNSSLESIVCGVPVVAFPQRMDQMINAKLIGDTWKTGVVVTVAESGGEGENGIIGSEEIKRCIEMVMGEEGKEMRRNAKELKESAMEATKEGGSSFMNIRGFMEDLSRKG